MTSLTSGRSAVARAVLLAGAAGIVLGLAPAARAQDQAAQADTTGASDAALEGNQIIVTATKREQTLQDVPVAVSVTSAQTIERAQIRDIKDLTSVVPSLRVTQLQSSANTNFIIRGFGNGANNAGIEPSVGVFIDGVYRSRSAAQIADFPDVSRIEVLRGPQSTLFGKNASAGVISIVTQKPQFELGGNVEASYGNYDALVLKGSVTGPVSQTLALSLAGGYNKRKGYNEDLGTGDRTNERNRWFVRGQALWEPNSDLSVRLIGDYGDIDEECCGVVNLKPSDATTAVRLLGGNVNAVGDRYANKVYTNFGSSNKIKNWGGSAQVDYDLGNVTLTSITAYRGVDAETNQDSDFTSADLIGRNYQDVRIRTFTQELRVASDFDGPLNFLAGGYYFNEKINQANQIQWGSQARPYASVLIQGSTGCLASPPAATCTNLAGLEGTIGALTGQNYAGKFFASGTGLDERYRLKNEAYSLFGQADFKLGDRITITGGVNYTKDTKNFSTNVTSSDVFASLPLNQIGGVGLTRQFISTVVGNVAGLGRAATAAEVQGFALAQPAAFGQISAQATAFGALNANLTPAAAAADANPLTVGNPLLNLRPLQFLPPFLNLPNSVEPGRTSDDKVTWVARVAFDMTDNINLYASYATGFKASSINLSRDSRPFPADRSAIEAAGLAQVNQSYGSRFAGPESTKVYEIGLKANWSVASANIAVFQQSISGFQSNVFTGSGFVLANAGKQTVKGIEFEGTFHPSRPLTLSASFTYLDARYDSFVLSAVGDLSGSRPAGIPELSSTIAGTYDLELPGDHHLILRADFHYESDSQIVEGLPGYLGGGTAAAVAAARPFTRDVRELNASLTWALPMGLEITAWGRNLTDNRYLLSVFDSVAQPLSISGYTNQPRTYGGTVRYRF